MRLEIISAKRHTTALVSEMVSLGGDPETWLIGLELDVPGNFWGIDYAPADWKIEEETPQPATIRHKDPVPAGKPAGRWRLTDITTGACYLETAAPVAEGEPVLLSIRAANTECLLDGIVRASHARAGMGVEFTNPEQRTRIEELINRLMSTREVPRIFVGRKEGLQKREALRQVAQRREEEEAHDPLLELVREGSLLPVEQFVSDLRAQRLGKRRDPRLDVAVAVLLTGIDENGRPLDQRVMTTNISRRGAQLEGVHGRLRPGDRVALARGHKKERFRVVWAGEAGTAMDGRISVAAVETNSTFWDDLLAGAVETQESTSARDSGSENGSEMPATTKEVPRV